MKDYTTTLHKMNFQLSTTNDPIIDTSIPRIKPRYKQTAYKASLKLKPLIKIYLINTVAFHLLSKRKSKDEIFTITFHEVNTLIQERKAEY